MANRWRGIGIGGLIVLLALLAFAPAAGAAPRAQDSDSIDVADQPLVNGTITLAEVNATQDGWIAVHVDDGGKPGKVIGHGPVKKGKNSKVAIKLDEDVPVGGKLWPMLHVDAGKIGTYEFPGPDVPVVVNNDIVMEQIAITATKPGAAQPAPAGLPKTGGADQLAGLLMGALALLVAGGLLRLRRRA
ncbi:MAG TPA: LPXTG cell wall anchor domain-containing protein [Roseiflexaceae bacterium]